MSYALHDSTGLRVITPPERAIVTSLACKPSPVCRIVDDNRPRFVTSPSRLSTHANRPRLYIRIAFVLDNRPRLCYCPTVKQETKIRFETDTLDKLDALSARSGRSIAALVRWCVDKSLPTLAGNIERSLAVPIESTIDTKLDA